ncbi:MAG TPA: hypothetical protein VM688_02740, partial [Nocardioidaceae bacterium]|nr:hypothetical protein [Nocardioidaceae bacterium]
MTASTGETRVLDAPPSTVSLMLKAALPAVPGLNLVPGVRKHGGLLPDLTLTRYDVRVDQAHLTAYSRICGFPLMSRLPLTYPHVLAFGLHLAIMTDAVFPFPAIGTVHLENAITQHRTISPSERLEVAARPRSLRSHPRGRLFDLVTEVRAGGELVWEESSTFLRLGGGDAAAPGVTRRLIGCRRRGPDGTCPRISAGATRVSQVTTIRY